jgi:hypothetical protein
VDRGLYDRHLHFFATLVLRLCNTERVPYDLSQPVALLASHLEALVELASGVKAIDLDGLLKKTGRLETAIGALPRTQPGQHRAQRLINETTIKASREISFLWTEADKYDQDPYGYSLIGQPVPRLLVPIRRLVELEPGSQDFHLWMTKFVRQRNRVADAIDRATDYLALTTALLEECT